MASDTVVKQIGSSGAYIFIDKEAYVNNVARVLNALGITTRAQLKAWVLAVTGVDRAMRAMVVAGVRFHGESAADASTE